MHLEILQKFGFDHIGSIQVNADDTVCFEITNPEYNVSQDSASVYAWVENDVVKYIGKAGKGIKKRLKEHTQGWNGGSVTGVRKAQYIRESVANTGNPIQLYGRRCNTVECFGVAVSNISTEETALIQVFDPEWNVEGRR